MSEAQRPLNEQEQREYMKEWMRVREQYGPDDAEEGRAAATDAAEAKIAEMRKEGEK